MLKEILVCKLKNISFEAAEKEFEKVIKEDFIKMNYKSENEADEQETYRDSKNDKTYKVYTRWNKEKNSYDLKISELVEQREIKVIKINRDYFYTKINGSEKEIIEHYNRYNCSCDNKENIEVKEIEFLASGEGIPGCTARKIIYNFEYDKKLNCFQY